VTDEPAVPDLSVAYRTLRRNAAVTREVDRLRSYLARPVDRELLLTLRVKSLPFGLTQMMRLDSLYANPVEWAGAMPMMDWIPTARDVEWVLRDPATGKENMAIDWTFRRGQLVRLKLINDRHTLHAMSHPIHVHGQRFLVLARNGDASENLVWKDTVLLPAGGTADLLVEMSNPGQWMVHCHIAEHLEAGMHAVFGVIGGEGR
jgi:suppressor of ftsI